jgi:hypothetical protein
MGTLTPAPLLPAPGQVSLIHDRALPDIPSPTTPCAPVFRQCFLLRAGLASDSLCAIGGSSDFAHSQLSHQSHQALSSLCRNPWLGRSSTDYPFTSSCSPPRVATTQLLSVSGGKLRHRGTLTLLGTLTLKRTEASPLSRLATRDPIPSLAHRDGSRHLSPSPIPIPVGRSVPAEPLGPPRSRSLIAHRDGSRHLVRS